LLSAAILGFEVALTRLFSVLLRYHFAFLVISVALCGMGLGGFAAQWGKRRGWKLALPTIALLFAGTMVVSVALMLRVVFAFSPDAYWMAAVLVLIPFLLAGLFLAEAFDRYPAHSGRIYAWDLAGAALAAAGIVLLLAFAGAINACLLVAALAALAAIFAEEPSAQSQDVAEKSTETASGQTTSKAHGAGFASVFAPLVFMALAVINHQFRILDIPAVPPKLDAQGASLADRGVTQPLFTELADPRYTTRIIDTKWNAFARTDVVAETPNPDTYLVYTNGNVPTNMMKWDGKASSLPYLCSQFPLTDWVFANAPLGKQMGSTQVETPQGAVLSIGPGGGLDALMALRWGAERFDGAEINPSIVGLMHEYRDFNGGIYEKPNINVVTADGRAAVQDAVRDGRRYALLFSALTKTATAGQGMALLESFIYTQDAFSDYWDALDTNGQLAIVTDQPPLLARLFATSLAMLEARGIDPKTACRHIVLAADSRPGPYRYAFVLSKTPFTTQQTFQQSDSTSGRGIEALWIPERAASPGAGPYPEVAAGRMNLAQFIDWWRTSPELPTPLDISPCPDNRPFVLDLNTTQSPIFGQLAAFALILALALAALSWTDASTAPIRGGSPRAEAVDTDVVDETTFTHSVSNTDGISARNRWLFTLYFTCLGVGFMMVEIPLAQKLILPLGYPTLALTTILFSILLGGGAGSWFSQRFEGTRLRMWAVSAAIGVVLLTSLAAFSLARIDDALLGLPIATRCIVAGIALLPFGFLLGTPFPSGMRLFAERYPHHVPLLWGLNGVASVVGSLAAALGAKMLGFDTVLLIGASIYALAAALLFLTRIDTE
jgi:hypothetical protein